MNWKGFLKPDWRKIVIFVILITLGYFFPLIPTYEQIECKPCLEPLCPPCRPIWFWNTIPQVFRVLSLNPPLSQFYLQFFFTFLIELIIWYLLSCLIVWIYDKYKKKRIK